MYIVFNLALIEHVYGGVLFFWPSVMFCCILSKKHNWMCWFLLLSTPAPFPADFVRHAVPRRPSTTISTVRQASTQAPHYVNNTQRMGNVYLHFLCQVFGYIVFGWHFKCVSVCTANIGTQTAGGRTTGGAAVRGVSQYKYSAGVRNVQQVIHAPAPFVHQVKWTCMSPLMTFALY